MPISEKQLNKALQAQTEEMTIKNQEFTEEIQRGCEILNNKYLEAFNGNTEAVNNLVNIVNKLQIMVDSLSDRVKDQDISLKEALKTQAEQKEIFVDLKIKLENAEIRARSNNLIFHEIKEETDEAGPDLKRKISNFSISITTWPMHKLTVPPDLEPLPRTNTKSDQY